MSESLSTRILFVTNVDWFFISHRLVIAEEAKREGFEVIVAAEDTGRSHEIVDRGIEFINLSFSRSGTNVLKEIFTLIKFIRIYYEIRPDIVHHVTMKPVIYGSIAAKFMRVKNVINAVSGLGYAFTDGRNSLISKLMLFFLKYGFNNDAFIIFQNIDDFKEMSNLNVLSTRNKIYFIKGSGVNLKEFYPTPLPKTDIIRIVLPARMLWDKGIGEFHAAAMLLKSLYFNKIQFLLVGRVDVDNKSGIPKNVLQQWADGDYFKWVGHQEDIFNVYKNSHVVVLPSYREGMPKSLIEACAMGRAIITTEAIGCRDCVDGGINGLKVPIKDPQSLADAIEFLVKNPDRIIQMGIASRLKAENEFSIVSVINTHLEIYKKCE